jgi:hypothetical protein
MRVAFMLLLLGLFVYEGIALYRAKGDTISEIMWAATAKRPLIPFLMGMLMGHFFWRW